MSRPMKNRNTTSSFFSRLTQRAMHQVAWGYPIIFLRNMLQSAGPCNGTRLLVRHLDSYRIYATIFGGVHHGEDHVIARFFLDSGERNLPIKIQRRQNPVRLCCAMTVNKAQGRSSSHVGIDFRSKPLSHGQFYVAMSRVTDVRKLAALLPKDANRLTHNIL